MANLQTEIAGSVQNFFGSAASQTDEWRNWLKDSTSNIPGVGALVGIGDAAADGVAALITSAFGDGSGGAPGTGANYPPGQPSFSGGQCAGTQYRVFVDIIRNGIPARREDTRIGPIGRPRYDLEGNTYRGRWYRPDDTTVLWSFDSIGVGFGEPEIVDYGILSVQQGPDNCGDLPSDPNTPSQEPPTGTDNITYDGPDGLPVGPGPLTIKPGFPYIGPSGNLLFPVEVCLVGFCINFVFDPFAGTVTPVLGGEPDTSPCCPPVIDGPDEGGPDDPDGPESEERIWGVKVTATVGQSGFGATEKSDGSGPSLFLPDLGFVRFAILVGGQRGWTEKVAIQSLSQFVPVNAPATAYAYDLFERPGVTLTATPVIVKQTIETVES